MSSGVISYNTTSMKQERVQTRQNHEKTRFNLKQAERSYYNPDAAGHDELKHEQNQAKLVFLAEKNPIR